jgi:hypothetical protein
VLTNWSPFDTQMLMSVPMLVPMYKIAAVTALVRRLQAGRTSTSLGDFAVNANATTEPLRLRNIRTTNCCHLQQPRATTICR